MRDEREQILGGGDLELGSGQKMLENQESGRDVNGIRRESTQLQDRYKDRL